MRKASLLVKRQVGLWQHLFCRDIESARKIQDRIGNLGAKALSTKVRYIPQHRGDYDADYAMPHQPSRDAVILYLHGGGYTAGSLDYARGFGGVLAELTHVPTLCVAYRLAPENPYPAALDDAFAAYQYLTQTHPRRRILLMGESAGGGLCYALCLKIKQAGMQQPACVVALSPWTDLTLSFDSHRRNAKEDPTLSRPMLTLYASLYAGDNLKDPLVSPAFGELSGLPDSLIIAGSSEILEDDSREMAKRLQAAGCNATLHIEEGGWHVYVMYATYEARQALDKIAKFLEAYTA